MRTLGDWDFRVATSVFPMVRIAAWATSTGLQEGDDDDETGMVREKKTTLYVEASHIAQADPDVINFDPLDLAQVQGCQAAVPQLLANMDDQDVQAEVAKVDELLGSSSRRLKYVVAFCDSGTDQFTGIRDLRTETLGRLVTICGTVTRTTDIKPELLVASWQCGECKREVSGIKQAR
ncbi:DNA replication licensing factor mcm6 [Symbiodinium microadriaticum]|uniref:DNA replication licensing factor mcm6 n=1 Tax=Symbiodinium microadriaticum TaxID=2951 RepID=A0A1Q9EH18_SYMMI|nr:DNA replication licensing factor mcm6 [Symbiodinium microadriaticum]